MCLKVVIEDPVEDTKFAQEMFKKNTFSVCTSIAARYLSIEARNLLPPWYKLDLSSSQISKNQQCQKAHNLFI